MSEFKCEDCNKFFESEESLNQHNSMKHSATEISGKKGKVNSRKYFIIGISVLIVIFLAMTVYSYSNKPGNYDEFATCLTDSGVVVYGNDHCSYTLSQLSMFGKSKTYLNYVKCTENGELCDEKEVSLTPTWEIGENKLEGVQGLQKLSDLSECELG
jgi:hypothetical protein